MSLSSVSAVCSSTDLLTPVGDNTPVKSEMKAWHSGIPHQLSHHWHGWQLAAAASQAYVERVFSVCVWSSHFRKEKSSLQEASQHSFSESEQ